VGFIYSLNTISHVAFNEFKVHFVVIIRVKDVNVPVLFAVGVVCNHGLLADGHLGCGRET
jgi:hypothetical protein